MSGSGRGAYLEQVSIRSDDAQSMMPGGFDVLVY